MFEFSGTGYRKRLLLIDEPLEGSTPEELSAWLADNPSEETIAKAFADIENKIAWLEGEEYAHPEGTPEYDTAYQLTETWLPIEALLSDKVINILKSEGVDFTKTQPFDVIKAFMERNGQLYVDGWWISKEECDAL